MADQDDTLIDMPLLDDVLDVDDDDDEDGDNNDICDGVLTSKLQVSDKQLALGGSSGPGDTVKPVVNTDTTTTAIELDLNDSTVKAEGKLEGEPDLEKVKESEPLPDSISDSASSESSNSSNSHNIESTSALKDGVRRLSTASSTTTATSPTSDIDIVDGAPTYHTHHHGDDNTNNSVFDSTTPNTNNNSSNTVNNGDSTQLSPSSLDTQQTTSNNHDQQQEHDHEQCVDSTNTCESIDSSNIESETDFPRESTQQTSSTSRSRSGSTGSRLLSSDSDFGYSQESIVTVEVIAIPRSILPVENSQQDSVNEEPVEVNQQQEGEEQRQAQSEGDDNTSTPAAAIVGEEEEENTVVETEVVEMGDQQRLEEKLRQFENDAKERDEDANRNTDGSVHQISELEKQRRRNLIFDEERFEETFLKCLICREVYNETDKLPKMLHCHHTFCMDCLYQMYRVEGEFRQSLTSVFRNMPLTVKIQCPTCREGIIISEAELRRLPNDHTIMELLCFVNKTGKNDVQYCPKHQMQPLNFFCEPCIMPVCCDCTVLDHKETKGHRVVNVDEAMKKYAPIVDDTLNDIRKEKTTLAGKRETLENTREDLNRIQSGISDQIRKVFDSIREVLDERERELHDVAVSEVDRKQGIIEGHLNTIAEREADLNAEFNSLQMATDDKDISLIFTGHKSARDLLTRKVFIPTNSTAGFSITFQFSSRADTVIKQQVANLGDVIFHS